MASRRTADPLAPGTRLCSQILPGTQVKVSEAKISSLLLQPPGARAPLSCFTRLTPHSPTPHPRSSFPPSHSLAPHSLPHSRPQRRAGGPRLPGPAASASCPRGAQPRPHTHGALSQAAPLGGTTVTGSGKREGVRLAQQPPGRRERGAPRLQGARLPPQEHGPGPGPRYLSHAAAPPLRPGPHPPLGTRHRGHKWRSLRALRSGGHAQCGLAAAAAWAASAQGVCMRIRAGGGQESPQPGG